MCYKVTCGEEALDPLRVVRGAEVGGGSGGERDLVVGQLADPLPHLVSGRHRVAVPVEGARDEVSDLFLPLLPLPIIEMVMLQYYIRLTSFTN